MSARATREAGVWVDQSAQASNTLRERAVATTRDAWTQFDSWYDAAAVAAYAREVANVSAAGQETVTDLLAEYLAHVTAAIRDEPRIQVPKVKAKPVRNGVDPMVVHSRPARVFRETFALTGDDEVALQRAVERGIRLIEDDLMLAARQAQQDAMLDLRVTRYRRVLRPELSQDGPCGLCVVAASQVYRVAQLMPLHGRCKCETMPVIGDPGGDGDPGLALNREDLDKIYEVAGSKAAADLKRTRVTLSEHGELGPVLRVSGHKFTGPGDLGGPIDPGARDRNLDALKRVLAKLEQRDRDGEDVDAQLGEQQRLIEKTETAATSAGGSGSGSDEPPDAPPAGGDDSGEGFDETPFPGDDLDRPDYSLLTEDEKNQIAYYASAGAMRLNPAMRGEQPMTADLATMRDQIRSGLQKYPLPRTYRLSRWSDIAEFGISDYSQIQSVEGSTYRQLGFMSTSVNDYPPAVTYTANPVILELLVPAGTPALRITGQLADPDNEIEREVLVIDARELTILSVVWDLTKKRWKVRASVTPEEAR